ncbi:MAG: type I methionyl aminopeptidase [Parcubacteria group bacterium]|nr:type I methionyl aminopeptidase [Parcubacteria group bacterium]|tara:strand:- start:316 stop:1083 length:768 start_codon:yes stop_codon:yes gene_type:complete
MSLIKSKEDIDLIREGGHKLAQIVEDLVTRVGPGVRTDELDKQAEAAMREFGARPAFLDYSPGGHRPFNSTICACINEEVVHAPAHPGRELKEGDIFSIDIGMEYKGRYTDMAVTVPVGKISDEAQKIIDVTKRSFFTGLEGIKAGESINVIGKAVQEVVEGEGYHIVRALVGHGVGHAVHEDPQVPNFNDPRAEKIKLEEGMVLAIEPMVTTHSHEVTTADDGWTVIPKDGGLSAHWEHTLVVTKDGYEILTKI